MRRVTRILIFILLGLVVLCLALVGISALSNRNLPGQSNQAYLSALDKARLAEIFHLRQSLGDQVWPGWGGADIPVIVYNDAYVFLVGLQDPADGWMKMPQKERRGSAWEAVTDDDFFGQLYYRQPLPGPGLTPEAFTVLVGDRWAATFETLESGEASFYAGFRQDLPAWLRPIFPYRLAWNALMGDVDAYIGALEHEAFHAFQGAQAYPRFEAAELANRLEDQYPWDDPTLDDAWQKETDLLVQAVRAPGEAEAADLARQFLDQRQARRAFTGLDQDLIDYERQLEWLEGLAKYAELSIQIQAATAPAYQPVPEMTADPSFNGYHDRQRFWSSQLNEAKRTSGRSGDTRFYYSGFAQAALLDRLMPDWKESAFKAGATLEGLIAQAVQ